MMLLFSHDRPVLRGEWPEHNARWEFYLSNTLPTDTIHTAVAGVAIRSLKSREVLLKQENDRDNDSREGFWEIPGGRLDPLDPSKPHGPKEHWKDAFVREAEEECGALVSPEDLELFAYRLIYNPPSSSLPRLACMPYCLVKTDAPPILATDPRMPIVGTFTEKNMDRMVEKGIMHASERDIAVLGLDVATQYKLMG